METETKPITITNINPGTEKGLMNDSGLLEFKLQICCHIYRCNTKGPFVVFTFLIRGNIFQDPTDSCDVRFRDLYRNRLTSEGDDCNTIIRAGNSVGVFSFPLPCARSPSVNPDTET